MMRKQVYAATIAVLLVLSVFAVLQWQIFPVQAVAVFDNGFEEGQFNPSPGVWSDNGTSGTGSTASVQSGIVKEGSYGGCFHSAASGYSRVHKYTTDPGATCYVRWYWYFEAMPISLTRILDVADYSGHDIAAVYVNSTAIRLTAKQPSQTNYEYAITYSSATWYCLELKFVSNAVTGEYRIYAGGVDVIDVTSINTSGAGNLRSINLGVPTAGSQAVTEYVDSVLSSATYNGPLPMAPILQVALNSPTTASNLINQSIDFQFTPVTYGTNIQNASLWTNITGSWTSTQTNTSAVTNNTLDTIAFASWPSFSTIVWNIAVWNTTTQVFAIANFTFTIWVSSLVVTLNSPSSGMHWLNGTVQFIYTPISIDTITVATLWTNITGSWAASQENESAITNGATNTISLNGWPSVATYVWNIGVENTTDTMFAPANFTFNLASTNTYSYTYNATDQMRGVYFYADSGVTSWDTIASTLAAFGVNMFDVDAMNNHYARFPNAYVSYSNMNLSGCVAAMHANNIAVYFHIGTMAGRLNASMDTYYYNSTAGGVTIYDYDWMDIANPIVEGYMKPLLQYMVSTYNPDGIVLDYTRWDDFMPLGETYDMPQFKLDTGLDAAANYTTWISHVCDATKGGTGLYYKEFLEWRMELIDVFVKNITDWVHAIDSGVVFGCSPHAIPFSSNPDYWPFLQGQDVAYWIKEGYVQWIAPMMYSHILADYTSQMQNEETYRIAGPHGVVPVYPFITVGGISFGYNNTVDEVKSYVNAVLDAGADGYILYGYGGPGSPGGSPTYGYNPDMRPYFAELTLPQTFSISDLTTTALNSTSIEVSWTTSSATNSTFEYSLYNLFSWSELTATGMLPAGFPYWKVTYIGGTLINNATVDTAHLVTLTGLTPATLYYYRVQCTDFSGIATSLVETMYSQWVTVLISSPTNTTCTSSSISVSFTATGDVIDQYWFNCKNGTDWVYGSNQTYIGTTTMTGFTNKATYTFYAWANNTLGNIGVATIVFTLDYPLIIIVATSTWWSGWW